MVRSRITSTFLVIFMCFISSCLEDGDKTLVLEDLQNQPGTGSITGTSQTFTQLSRSGFLLTVPIQAISETTSGNEGKLVFSLDVTDELPKALPSCLERIGYVAKIEPFNFNFRYSVTLALPIGNNKDVENLKVYRFNEYTNEWSPVPVSGYGEKTIIISTFSLGYFVVVRDNCATADLGGIRFVHPSGEEGYFYTITLSGYEGNAGGYYLNGTNAYTIPLGNGRPNQATYIPFIPQGYYGAYIAREKRSTISSDPTSVEYYSYVSYVNVENVLNRRSESSISDWNGYSGWTDLTLRTGGRWISGRPDIWGSPTMTYGTGKFQTTLTWVNSSSSAVDYDLHLYGPGSLHVYFDNQKESCFELDRDWLQQTGNAIENIYSIRDDFPSGEYAIKVHLYSGQTGKEFNCRVLYDGVIVKSIRSSLSRVNDFQEIYTFTIQ